MISQPLGRLQSAEIDTETPLESRLDVYNFSSLNIYNETPPRRWQICLLEGMNYRNPPLPLFEQEIGRHLSLQIQSNSLMNWSALIHTDDQRRRSESPAGARAQSAHNVFIIILIWFLWIQAWCGAEHMAFFIMGAEVLAPVLSAPEQFFSPRPGFSFFFFLFHSPPSTTTTPPTHCQCFIYDSSSPRPRQLSVDLHSCGPSEHLTLERQATQASWIRNVKEILSGKTVNAAVFLQRIFFLSPWLYFWVSGLGLFLCAEKTLPGSDIYE